jgi:cytochrome c oxidase subunit 2
MKKVLLLAAALGFVFALSACGNNQDAAPASDASPANAQQVKLEASNWKFDQPEYHVKKGQPVTVSLDLKQGLHSAVIKDFNVTLDSNKKTATFTPDKTGSFEIRCMIPCGPGHANMVSKLVVE